jgi:hypothetical protein
MKTLIHIVHLRLKEKPLPDSMSRGTRGKRPPRPLAFFVILSTEKNRMSVEELYKQRYKTGATPWDIGKPDFNLIETVNKTPIKPCKALDIGCGTGDNSIWLP